MSFNFNESTLNIDLCGSVFLMVPLCALFLYLKYCTEIAQLVDRETLIPRVVGLSPMLG